MAKQKPTEHGLNIFEVLKSISTKQYDYIDKLPDGVKSKFVPYTTMRWLTGSSNMATLVLVNEFVNPYVFSFRTHSKLLYLLMTAVSSGHFTKYKWIGKQKKDTSDGNYARKLDIIKLFYKVSKREAITYEKILTINDIVEMGQYIGYDAKELKSLT
jgi:hypothetical protein